MAHDVRHRPIKMASLSSEHLPRVPRQAVAQHRQLHVRVAQSNSTCLGFMAVMATLGPAPPNLPALPGSSRAVCQVVAPKLQPALGDLASAGQALT